MFSAGQRERRKGRSNRSGAHPHRVPDSSYKLKVASGLPQGQPTCNFQPATCNSSLHGILGSGYAGLETTRLTYESNYCSNRKGPGPRSIECRHSANGSFRSLDRGWFRGNLALVVGKTNSGRSGDPWRAVKPSNGWESKADLSLAERSRARWNTATPRRWQACSRTRNITAVYSAFSVTRMPRN